LSKTTNSTKTANSTATPEIRPLSDAKPSDRSGLRRSAAATASSLKNTKDLLASDNEEKAIEVPNVTEPYLDHAPADIVEEDHGVLYDSSVYPLDDKDNSAETSKRKEPSLGSAKQSGTQQTTQQAKSLDDTKVEESQEPVDGAEKKPGVGQMLFSELVAKIPGEKPLKRDDILKVFRKYDYLLARKMQVFGVNSLTNAWADVELESETTNFLDIGVSVQLADKTGALTRKELNTMSQMVLEFAEVFDRRFNFSMDLDDAIEHGRTLDNLARKHCAMVVLNIVPKRKSGFRSSDFESCSRDLKMIQSEKGVFTRYRIKGNHNVAEYNVAVADDKGKFRPITKQKPFHIHDIVVYLNVPRVAEPMEVFDTMLEESRKLATWLDGKLVDKQRRNLTTRMARKFKEQIHGLKPGDSISQKLF